MASDNEASCVGDPNFAVICSFLEKFGTSCGITIPDFYELQQMLENTQEVSTELIDLHIKLLRKVKKSVSADRWERVLIKVCHNHCIQDAWELERFGYKKARLASKLRILKILLEMQFDFNQKFKSEVNRLTAKELRTEPIGRDKHGRAYWYQLDEHCQMRVYREDPDEETWLLIAKDRSDLVRLISQLSSNDSSSGEVTTNEDSNSLETEKPVTDTGQTSSSVSNFGDDSSVGNENSKLNVIVEKSHQQNSSEENKACHNKLEMPKDEESNNKFVVEMKQKEDEFKNEKEEMCSLDLSVTSKQGVDLSNKKNINELPINLRIKAMDQLRKSPIQDQLIDLSMKKHLKSSVTVPAYSDHESSNSEEEFDDEEVEEEEDEDNEYESDEIDIPTHMIKRPRLDRPTLLGNAKKKTYSEEEEDDDEDDNETDDEAETGDEIEEPVMMVHGEGSGRDCETGNVLLTSSNSVVVSEAIEEPIQFIYGEGNGHDCDTGNTGGSEDESDKSDNLETKQSSDSKHLIVTDESACKQITKSHKIGKVVIDVKSTDKLCCTSEQIPCKKNSRWDMKTLPHEKSPDEIMLLKTEKLSDDSGSSSSTNFSINNQVENEVTVNYEKQIKSSSVVNIKKTDTLSETNLCTETNEDLKLTPPPPPSYTLNSDEMKHVEHSKVEEMESPKKPSMFFFGPGCFQFKTPLASFSTPTSKSLDKTTNVQNSIPDKSDETLTNKIESSKKSEESITIELGEIEESTESLETNQQNISEESDKEVNTSVLLNEAQCKKEETETLEENNKEESGEIDNNIENQCKSSVQGKQLDSKISTADEEQLNLPIQSSTDIKEQSSKILQDEITDSEKIEEKNVDSACVMDVEETQNLQITQKESADDLISKDTEKLPEVIEEPKNQVPEDLENEVSTKECEEIHESSSFTKKHNFSKFGNETSKLDISQKEELSNVESVETKDDTENLLVQSSQILQKSEESPSSTIVNKCETEGTHILQNEPHLESPLNQEQKSISMDVDESIEEIQSSKILEKEEQFNSESGLREEELSKSMDETQSSQILQQEEHPIAETLLKEKEINESVNEAQSSKEDQESTLKQEEIKVPMDEVQSSKEDQPHSKSTLEQEEINELTEDAQSSLLLSKEEPHSESILKEKEIDIITEEKQSFDILQKEEQFHSESILKEEKEINDSIQETQSSSIVRKEQLYSDSILKETDIDTEENQSSDILQKELPSESIVKEKEINESIKEINKSTEETQSSRTLEEEEKFPESLAKEKEINESVEETQSFHVLQKEEQSHPEFTVTENEINESTEETKSSDVLQKEEQPHSKSISKEQEINESLEEPHLESTQKNEENINDPMKEMQSSQIDQKEQPSMLKEEEINKSIEEIKSSQIVQNEEQFPPRQVINESIGPIQSSRIVQEEEQILHLESSLKEKEINKSTEETQNPQTEEQIHHSESLLNREELNESVDETQSIQKEEHVIESANILINEEIDKSNVESNEKVNNLETLEDEKLQIQEKESLQLPQDEVTKTTEKYSKSICEPSIASKSQEIESISVNNIDKEEQNTTNVINKSIQSEKETITVGNDEMQNRVEEIVDKPITIENKNEKQMEIDKVAPLGTANIDFNKENEDDAESIVLSTTEEEDDESKLEDVECILKQQSRSASKSFPFTKRIIKTKLSEKQEIVEPIVEEKSEIETIGNANEKSTTVEIVQNVENKSVIENDLENVQNEKKTEETIHEVPYSSNKEKNVRPTEEDNSAKSFELNKLEILQENISEGVAKELENTTEILGNKIESTDSKVILTENRSGDQNLSEKFETTETVKELINSDVKLNENETTSVKSTDISSISIEEKKETNLTVNKESVKESGKKPDEHLDKEIPKHQEERNVEISPKEINDNKNQSSKENNKNISVLQCEILEKQTTIDAVSVKNVDSKEFNTPAPNIVSVMFEQKETSTKIDSNNKNLITTTNQKPSFDDDNDDYNDSFSDHDVMDSCIIDSDDSVENDDREMNDEIKTNTVDKITELSNKTSERDETNEENKIENKVELKTCENIKPKRKEKETEIKAEKEMSSNYKPGLICVDVRKLQKKLEPKPNVTISKIKLPKSIEIVGVNTENEDSIDIIDAPETDPLACTEEVPPTVKSKNETLSLSTFKLDEPEKETDSSLLPEPIRRALRNRSICITSVPKKESLKRSRTNMEESGASVEKKRKVDNKQTSSKNKVVEAKTQVVSSEEEEEEETRNVKNKSSVKKKSSGKEEKKQGKKALPVKIEEDSPAPSDPSSETPKKKRRFLDLEVDPSLILTPDNQENSTETNNRGTVVRHSRRIAQIKIKEEAERRKLEEMALIELKEEQKKKKYKKDEDQDYKADKKKKKPKPESDDENASDEDEEQSVKKKHKKKRKHQDLKKLFNIANPWQTSSGSSTSNEEEEEEDEEEEEEPEYHAAALKSDHEFSPESDLENSTELQPLRRARTVKKESDTEEPTDEQACQKCGNADHPEWILLCDKCDCGWHCSCLRPALLVIPEGDWFCPPCQHASLIEALKLQLTEYDKKLNRREMEVRRKERLAYVGISLDNVLPSAKETEIGKEQEDTVDHGDQSGSGTSDSDESSSESSSDGDSDEPIYQLRERRQAHSYRFNDYDELINSAIQEELEAVKGAGNQGRGKDISTIVNAEKEEAKALLEQQRLVEEKQQLEQNQNQQQQQESVMETVPTNIAEVQQHAAEEESEEELHVVPKHISKKKHRKLNSLDISSEDDPVDDEDFQGSSGSDEDDLDAQSEDSDDSELNMRGKNRGRFAPIRRSSRARTSRYDKDFINDDSEEEDTSRRKKSRSIWDETESEDSDKSWGRRKQKKRNHIPTPKTNKKKSKKKKRIIDSDTEVYKSRKPKKPVIKYGGLQDSDEELITRRTRGKKINYLDALGSDSEEEKPSTKQIESEEEYVANEEEEDDPDENPETVQKANDPDSIVDKPPVVPKKVIKLPKIKSPRARGRGKAGIPRAYMQKMSAMQMTTTTTTTTTTTIPPQPETMKLVNNPIVETVAAVNMPIIAANPDDLNEEEVGTMMMENEEYANKQLELMAIQLAKEKRKKEMEQQLTNLESESANPQSEQIVAVAEPKKRGRKKKVPDGNLIIQEQNMSAIPINQTMNPLYSEMVNPEFPLTQFGPNAPNHDEIPTSLTDLVPTAPKRRGRGKGKKTLAAEAAAAAAAGTATISPSSSVTAPLSPASNVSGTDSIPPSLPNEQPSPDSVPNGKLGIAAPPQPFSQNQPVPSVITRMLQSQPAPSGTPTFTPTSGGVVNQKYFPGMCEQSRGPSPSQFSRGGTPYRQSPTNMSMFPTRPVVPNSPHRLRSPGPQMFHSTHHSMDPSPSGGGPINITPANRDRSSPLTKDGPTPPPPPYTRATTITGNRFPRNESSPPIPVPIRHHLPFQQTGTHMQQPSPPPRAPPPGNFSPYHPPPPPNYHYGAYPPAPSMAAADDALPATDYQGSPYPEHYGTGAEHTVHSSEGSNSKPFDEEGSGGEFGGLVSYFSSQREDDLDT